MINGVFAVFFYIYGWNNPDESDCYAFDNTNMVSPVRTSGSTDVTQAFETWFKVGFFIKLAGVMYALIGFMSGNNRQTGKCAQLFGCVSCCGGLGLVIWGSIVRFQHTGQACSGVYYDDIDY